MYRRLLVSLLLAPSPYKGLSNIRRSYYSMYGPFLGNEKTSSCLQVLKFNKVLSNALFCFVCRLCLAERHAWDICPGATTWSSVCLSRKHLFNDSIYSIELTNIRIEGILWSRQVLRANFPFMRSNIPAPNINFITYSGGNATFQWDSRTEITWRNAWNRHWRMWSKRGSYQTIWSSPFTNVELHSRAWPCTMIPSISQTFNHVMTLLPNMIFYRNASGFVGRFHLVVKYVQ